MKPGPGSTTVPDEARLWFLEKYGVKYLVVEEGVYGVGVNRAQRRKAKKAKA